MGIKTFFEERKRFRENWREVENENKAVFLAYDPKCRLYAECMKQNPLEKTILYEAGEKEPQLHILMALFEAFVNRPDFAEYKHVWVLHKRRQHRALKQKYAGYENVKLWLIPDEPTERYYELLATASYLFHGKYFPFWFVKREGQYLMCIQEFGEGKPVGFESAGGAVRTAIYLHSFLQADTILVRDEAALSRLEASFRLNGIYEGNVWIADGERQAKDILEGIFTGTEPVQTKNVSHTEKKKILIHGSAMITNGVTEALLALLNEIDYEKYDVTMTCRMEKGFQSRRNIERVNPKVRILVTRGMDPMTEDEQMMTLYLKKYGISGKYEEQIYEKSRSVIQRAIRRRFGNTSFDYAIDFAGYAVWIALLMLDMPVKKRLIWEHTDIKEHVLIKSENGEEEKNIPLEGLLSVYSRFDKIVSVNRTLMEINRRKLGNEITEGRFCYATNVLDAKRIMEKVLGFQEDAVLTDERGKTYLVYDSERTSVDGGIKMLPFEKKKNRFDFVTMGRLAPEKNHANLILAFKRFLKEYPGSRLFIIGKGVLMEELQGLAAGNRLEKNVIFTGNLMNPYMLMKQCDCFVFTSYYEGQGLAVLEARTLGMPIILSDYEASSSVCVENGQYMVGMEQEDILQGFLAYAHGEVPTDYHFDLEEYNQKAIEEFYRVLED